MTASFARIRGNLRNLVLVAGALTLLGASSPAPAAYAAAPSCGAFTANVDERVHPTEHGAALSVKAGDTGRFTARGFVARREASMRMATAGGSGLVGVHRLYRDRFGPDYYYTANRLDIAHATTRRGYTDEGVAFYAATRPAECLVPVWSYEKDGVHRFISTSADAARLSLAGWKKEKIRFYAGRPKPDSVFTFAVYPDTQQEVLRAGDQRFASRGQWLADNRARLDLRFAVHVGDVVNWDTPDHIQYERARAALVPLQQAGIPYSLSPGNHDTAAVCAGGGACDPKRTRALVRDTSTFNRYFTAQSVNRQGSYERDKVDNTYQVYTAGGVGWLVLNLELWPRPGALSWAQRVVAAHPRHNVIVVTHSYLTSSGAISTSREYGDTAPSVLARELVLKYPNVRMVISGHAGRAGHRVDRGRAGNRVDTFLTTMHDNHTNPVRLVQVDTRTNSLKTWVYSPWTQASYPQYDVRVSGQNWVR